ncbi:transcription termination factor MTEF18, mitochondrial [Ricinus communis]|uniref:Transcription termination factor MTEF18, mitochondrial-like n=1 Tax=Ricinus communis TaxID=3988 RepID=B9SWI8_RICCO|nr:transcription termination factor MTEF18, mitochondrial [Ricinus communis]XP_015581600.1 transcription termination factor MTEF18, mitochondrial [Ricinus communis]XP_015581601.1 transcription termination factor MTEF18, mitochondrial [Ricinus communis]XP_015581602.1 transcription termination factor MTEF18, mitochondrial [Ricinus communis]XP_015581603.1 transcription termination factor MTEF18, mitochondrial [Ricinus communis]XP_015581604.1 transcription termination factor MTEF18, mitochondrial |eukprot:XP_002530357.1 transcription termination factor MTEF18, mitochondrial [Ricinus communis]
MTHLNKLQTLSILKWVSSNSVDCYKIPFLSSRSFFDPANNPSLYRKKRVVDNDNVEKNLMHDGQIRSQFSKAARKQAQAALLEYLRFTRSLQFTLAEHMSKNSPSFLEKLLQRVYVDEDVGWSVPRFLRYHPINEFEPFFESLGLRPYQFVAFLPHDLIFLSDDELLLENFHTLCNYGIPMNKIGRIFKEAGEIFGYNYGILEMKLRTYEELGLDQSLMGKIVVCSPYLLTGDVDIDFVKSMEIVRKGGIEFRWIEKHLSEKCSYNWSQLHALLNLFSKTGYNEEQLCAIISQHPGIIFEGSGNMTLSLIGFLVKFGSSINQICSMFSQFPQMRVGRFLLNMKQCFLFLTEIKLEILEIGKIIRSHPLMLGSCTLKKSSSLISILNAGKKRICNIILQNPLEMKNWVIGSKINPLPSERLRSRILKIKFLLDLGFVKNSIEMEKALKVFKGSGAELHERFDCIMQAGLDKKDACEIIRQAPPILNQKKEVIKMKIDFLVNDLGYPISSLLTFPTILTYAIPTVKLKWVMSNWLKDQGIVVPMCSLRSLFKNSDKAFIKRYVKLHPKGFEFWQNLKEKK